MDGQSGQPRLARNGFREITATLQDKIRGGRVVAGSYLPTERELQIDFGASRSTVRKALAALIESGWAQNIPNRGVVATRGIKPGESMNVGFIHTGNYVSQLLLSQVCGLLEPEGLNLVALGGRPEYGMRHGLLRSIENEYKGVFVWPNDGFPDVESISALAQQLPIVALDHSIPGIETDLVTFDYERAGFEATEHLIKQGSKRIGVTGMIDMLDVSHQRFKGYMRAMFAYGLQPYAPDFLFSFTSGGDEPNTSVLEQVLRSGNRPDAFFVMNDICLPSAVTSAHRAGLQVPDDIKFATVGDDIDLTIGPFRMTSVALDWESLARNAVRLLSERLADPNRPPQTFVVPHELRIRGLCGAKPEEWTSDSSSNRGSLGDQIPRVHYAFNSRWGSEFSTQSSRSGEILA